MALVLLGTEACHLCELAQDILLQSAAYITDDVFVEDIAESEEMTERYGMRIPVVLHEGSAAELDWPFTQEDLLVFLQKIRPISSPDTE